MKLQTKPLESEGEPMTAEDKKTAYAEKNGPDISDHLSDNRSLSDASEADDTSTDSSTETKKEKGARKKKTKNEVPRETAEAIEAILFAAGHAVPYTVMARVLDYPLSTMKSMVHTYAARYNESEMPRGVMLLTYDDSCQLCTKQQYLPFIRDALGIRHNGNLSNASIETLAIISYNQPVTRSYVDTVRGVDSSYAIGSLLERGLIESKGRLDAPGRPMLYGTTPDFLRCFGLSSIADLPGITSEEAAEMLAKIQRQMTEEMQPDVNQMSIDPAAIPADENAPKPDSVAVAIGETPEAAQESE